MNAYNDWLKQMQQIQQQNAAAQAVVPVSPQLPPVPTSLFDPNQYSKFGNMMARGGGFGPYMNPEIQNQVTTPADLEAYNQARLASRNKGLGQMMYALSDAFAGRDIGKGVMERQALQAPEYKIQQLQDGNYYYVDPTGSRPPTPVSTNIKQTGAYAGTSMDAQYLNDLEIGAVNPEFQKTSRYKVAYQEMHKPTTYINSLGQPETRPGLRPGTYPNPFGDVENEDGSTVGISQNERSTLIKSNIAVDDATDRIKVLAKSIQEIDPNPLTFGTERAEIDSKYTQLQLELKNLFALGVLAGADLDLLEAVTGNPTDWKQFLIRGGKDGSLIQLQSLLEIANINKNRNLIKLGQETQPTPDLFGVNEQATQERVRITLD